MSVTQKQRQIKEIVKCGKNPKYFFNRYVKIQHPIKGAIPFRTYDFQDECVEAFEEHRFNVILKSRQLGLSTISAAYAAWLAIFHKDKNVLVIATKLAVAQNFIRKVKFVIQSMPKWLLVPQIVNNNKQALEFSNGSTIKAIPTSEDAGRSEALTLLIVDEAAFVRNFDTLWTGLYPTLSTGGRAIVLSTPNGVGGQYYDIWKQAEEGENIFNPIKLPWDVHPDRGEDWFQEETKNMSRKQIAQELLCDFAASGDTFLQVEDIEYLRAWIRQPIDKWGPDMNVWVWEYPMSTKKYIISADVARGDAQDYSTFHVIDTEASAIVAEYRGKLPPDKFAQVLAEAGRRYNEALVCPENNSYGYAVVMKLNEINYRNLYFEKEKDRYSFLYGSGDIGKIGFQTNAKTRNQILTKLEEVLRTKQVSVKSSRLYEELKTFVWKNGKAQAQKGQNDDLIMALAIGVWLYDTSPQLNKHSVDLNSAMLAGFAVNSTKIGDTVLTKSQNTTDDKSSGERKTWGENNPYTDLDWLVK
ncbi:MAG: hypothetical protein CBC29_05655 [Methylococcaceae bacterium TMED69]|nr:MAG: hypothetical protein CBC29_05655 [Methylococcaceae bacterium TMED69]|tara:strand:- start:3843 stop:5423 length:1581 start_codon:yes stop_codon:yes gene_type:complete